MQTPATSPKTLRKQLEILLDTNVPLFLHGSPGIGKSEIVKQAATDRNWSVRDIRLSQLDPVDLRGIPVPEGGRTVWMPPVFFPSEEEEEGILFLDELNSAPVSVQAAVYQLILDRRLGEYELPPGWRIVCAGNRTTDRGVVFRLPSPLSNRMVHLILESNYDDFKEWALKNGVHPYILGFLGFRPDLLSTEAPADRETNPAFSTPRSWNMLSKVIRNREEELDRIAHLIYGSVGYGAGVEFIAYTKIYKEIPSVEGILHGEVRDVPGSPGSLFALTSALVERWDGSMEEAQNLIQYAELLPVEFNIILVKDCMVKEESFAGAPGFDSWVEKYGDWIL